MEQDTKDGLVCLAVFVMPLLIGLMFAGGLL